MHFLDPCQGLSTFHQAQFEGKQKQFEIDIKGLEKEIAENEANKSFELSNLTQTLQGKLVEKLPDPLVYSFWV
jgi:hypothetical protein